MGEIMEKGKAAKEASVALNIATSEEKDRALQLIADQLIEEREKLLAENKKDIDEGREKGIEPAVLDRILLTRERIEAMAEGVRLLIGLEDPIGETLEEIHKDNGLHIVKRRVPIGVIARPGTRLAARFSPAARIMAGARLPQNAAHGLAQRRPPAWLLIDVPMSNLSSSAIRAARAGTVPRRTDAAALPPAAVPLGGVAARQP